MLLSKSCIYAIRSALFLAVHKDRNYVPIKEVSHSLNISFHFLTKILQILTQSEIIKSNKGPNGGVTLKKPAEHITIYDIVYAIDGTEVFDQCALGLPGCSDEKPCPVHNTWGAARSSIKDGFTEESIADLANKIKDGQLRLYDVFGSNNQPK